MSNQARNQHGTGVAKSVLRGAQTMSNSFQLCPTDFSRGGGENVCKGGFAPLSPWLRACVQQFQSMSNTFLQGDQSFF